MESTYIFYFWPLFLILIDVNMEIGNSQITTACWAALCYCIFENLHFAEQRKSLKNADAYNK